jgi:hypothetical protein
MDEVPYKTFDDVMNFDVIYIFNITECPDFSTMYEFSDIAVPEI